MTTYHVYPKYSGRQAGPSNETQVKVYTVDHLSSCFKLDTIDSKTDLFKF